jgi:hypothetical protein
MTETLEDYQAAFEVLSRTALPVGSVAKRAKGIFDAMRAKGGAFSKDPTYAPRQVLEEVEEFQQAFDVKSAMTPSAWSELADVVLAVARLASAGGKTIEELLRFSMTKFLIRASVYDEGADGKETTLFVARNRWEMVKQTLRGSEELAAERAFGSGEKASTPWPLPPMPPSPPRPPSEREARMRDVHPLDRAELLAFFDAVRTMRPEEKPALVLWASTLHAVWTMCSPDARPTTTTTTRKAP